MKLASAENFILLYDKIVALARNQHPDSQMLGRAISFQLVRGLFYIGFEHGYVELDPLKAGLLVSERQMPIEEFSHELDEGINLNDWK